MTHFAWPEGFRRIPHSRWTLQPVEKLALNYDTVENHGWYRNLEPSVEQLAKTIAPGDIIIDYSGGTGILADRLLKRITDRPFGVVLVDSSSKFLRLALEKFHAEPRVAFRLIRYIKDRSRLLFVDEVVGRALRERKADILVSTNAIHLYYDLPDTVAAWRRIVKPGGHVFVQSGNIRNPGMKPGEWIIDETVDTINTAAAKIVLDDGRYAPYRDGLRDAARMAKYEALRRKYFLPVRPLDHYLLTLRDAGFKIEEVKNVTIEANVREWYDFLAVYHEGVLGWLGGAEKIESRSPTPESIDDRLAVMREALKVVFKGRDTFDACWTYIACRVP